MTRMTTMWVFTLFAALVCRAVGAEDNRLTEAQRAAGWKRLFDGESTAGWRTPRGEMIPQDHVQEGSLNPHPTEYMLVYDQPLSDFHLTLDFKISSKCNSGVFVRTFPLEPRPEKDVGYNGIEIAIDDTTMAQWHDTGAIYDLVKPRVAAMKRAGEWNHLEIRCQGATIDVHLNGQHVTHMNLEEWTTANRRPDGSEHKFDIAYKDHPRKGYLGLQDHGGDCWYKNIYLLPLDGDP